MLTFQEGDLLDKHFIFFIALKPVDEDTVGGVLSESVWTDIQDDDVFKITVEVLQVLEVLSIVHHRFLSETALETRLVWVQVHHHFLNELIEGEVSHMVGNTIELANKSYEEIVFRKDNDFIEM